MELINILDEDFVNYKKPSMFLLFPKCSMKCGKRCQNAALLQERTIDVRIDDIVERYMNNPITSAIVCGGLEPFDSWKDLESLIMNLRYHTPDDIVIYTGYTEEELRDKLPWLSIYENIIIKFGRYIHKQKPHRDEILGVDLASDNQYAKYIGEKLDVSSVKIGEIK